MPRASSPVDRFCVRHGLSCVWAGGERDYDAEWARLTDAMDGFFPADRPKNVNVRKSQCRQATVIDQRMRAHIFDSKRKDELADALVALQERNGGVHRYAEQVPPLALPSGVGDA